MEICDILFFPNDPTTSMQVKEGKYCVHVDVITPSKKLIEKIGYWGHYFTSSDLNISKNTVYKPTCPHE